MTKGLSIMLSLVMCITAVQAAQAHREPVYSGDIQREINYKVDSVLNNLGLENGRDANILFAIGFGMAGCVFSLAEEKGFTVCCALLAGYNIYEIWKKTKAIADLHSIKQIIREHITHLHGYSAR